VKLVHLFCFIIKKFVTMHGHMKVKFYKSLPTEPVTDKTHLYTHRDGSLKMFPESLYF